MTPTIEDELRAALRARRDDLSDGPDLTGAVRRGGARRQRRRRVALVAAPVLTAAAVAAAVVVLPAWSYSPPDGRTAATSLPAADRELLAAPTGGDLAGDAAYLAAVRRAWEGSHGRSDNADRGIFDHLMGEPNVVWAGDTAAGRAAVVVQLADLREHDNVQLTREGVALLWGFVGPDADGDPTVVADAYPVPGAPDVEAAWIGADRTVLLVADRGNTRQQVSWGLTYTPDGRAQRRWLPVTFDDGAAVLRAPAGTRPDSVRLRYGGGDAEIGNLGDDQPDGDVDRLPWQGGGGRPVFAVGPEPAAAWGGTLPDGDAAGQALSDGLAGRLPTGWPDARTISDSLWFAAGRTPDGRRLVAGDLAFDEDPSHLYVVLRGPGDTVRAVSGPVHRDRAVPVVLALPDGQGTLVAAKGRTFTWTAAGVAATAGNAALVPAGATDLRVDGAPVPLS